MSSEKEAERPTKAITDKEFGVFIQSWSAWASMSAERLRIAELGQPVNADRARTPLAPGSEAGAAISEVLMPHSAGVGAGPVTKVAG
jgi:hypothetical protein